MTQDFVPSTQLPVRAEAILYGPLVQAYIEPKMNRKQMRQALDEYEDWRDEQVKLIMQRGLGPFENLPPDQRRQMLMMQTDLADLRTLLVDADTLIKAAKDGQVQFRSPYWQQVFRSRDFIKKHFLGLFQDALQDTLEKMTFAEPDGGVGISGALPGTTPPPITPEGF